MITLFASRRQQDVQAVRSQKVVLCYNKNMQEVDHSESIQKVHIKISGTFIWLIVIFLFIATPFALGLSFARNGLTLNNKYYSSADFFRTLHFTSAYFFAFGYIVAALFLFFAVVSLIYIRTKPLKIIFLICLSILQFVMGFSYLMPAFPAHTFVVYATQSWKINAINVGILSAVVSAIFCLIIYIFFLIFKSSSLKFIKNQKFISIILLLTCLIIFFFISNNEFILSLFSALTNPKTV